MGGSQPTRVGSRVRVSRSSLAAVADMRPYAGPASIGSLLIANRGEIAVRVARTARRMGIRVIGVHATDERPPDGVDESTLIGSYLDADRAHRCRAARPGADAIHPGYGFLAENPDFAASGDPGRPGLGRSPGRSDRRHGRQGGRPAAGGRAWRARPSPATTAPPRTTRR